MSFLWVVLHWMMRVFLPQVRKFRQEGDIAAAQASSQRAQDYSAVAMTAGIFLNGFLVFVVLCVILLVLIYAGDHG